MEYEAGKSKSSRNGNVGLPFGCELREGADCAMCVSSMSRGRFAVLLIGMLRAAGVIAAVCLSPFIGTDDEDVLAAGETRRRS